jgi:DNA polymerase III gamma/tau subunit
MGKALYRKHRSKSFDEVIGQKHITDTLKNALKKGAISHAYLFTGPRGVGKTSIARILAHAVNDLSYSDETTHLDIIEIDAASNRRIDEIRDLRSEADLIRQECLKKAQQMLENNEDPAKVIETLASNLTNKFMHGPTVQMRRALKEDDQNLVALLHSLIKDS